jgi:hypothetical protein
VLTPWQDEVIHLVVGQSGHGNLHFRTRVAWALNHPKLQTLSKASGCHPNTRCHRGQYNQEATHSRRALASSYEGSCTPFKPAPSFCCCAAAQNFCQRPVGMTAGRYEGLLAIEQLIRTKVPVFTQTLTSKMYELRIH